jgi:hypothetical protein
MVICWCDGRRPAANHYRKGQIIAMRRGASAFPDPKLQEIYLSLADLIEQFVREFDRATN